MNDTVVVTGGSRGIGKSVTEAFAAAGYRVALIYASRRKEAEKTAESLRERMLWHISAMSLTRDR